MQNITIGRYRPDEGTITKVHYKGDTELRREIVHSYAGWVEGVREDGSSWILWLDENASPVMYYGRRESDGAVIGEPVTL